MKYVVIDLEMCIIPKSKRTGIYKWGHETIQIGAVLLNEDYEIVDTFMTYVSPRYGFINSKIKKLTGITQKMLEGAPDIEDALKAMVKWLPDEFEFVEWSENDQLMIQREIEGKELKFEGMEKLQNRTWIDSQKLFSKTLQFDRIYSLQEALNLSDIDYNIKLHDGLVDAYNTALLFKKLRVEEVFMVNQYYLNAYEGVRTMTLSLGDLLKNITLA